jgi:hypothetical protein
MTCCFAYIVILLGQLKSRSAIKRGNEAKHVKMFDEISLWWDVFQQLPDFTNTLSFHRSEYDPKAWFYSTCCHEHASSSR